MRRRRRSGPRHRRALPAGRCPAAGPAAKIGLPPDIKSRLGSAARNLLAIQIRVSELDAARPGTNGSPLLTTDRGPQTDFNVLALPHGRTSLLTGANDIGTPNGTTTWNFALEQSLSRQVRVGGGILYSRLGALARFDPGPFSLRGDGSTIRATRRSTRTAGVKIAPVDRALRRRARLLHSGRRTVFGIQLQF